MEFARTAMQEVEAQTIDDDFETDGAVKGELSEAASAAAEAQTAAEGCESYIKEEADAKVKDESDAKVKEARLGSGCRLNRDLKSSTVQYCAERLQMDNSLGSCPG